MMRSVNWRHMLANVLRMTTVIALTGFVAWLAWLLLHILFLIEFQNRLLVLIQWAWSYFTWSRSARLIVGPIDKPANPLA